MSLVDAFRSGGFEAWVQDLTFVGTRVQQDEAGRDYEVDDVTTLIEGCIVQPFGDAQVSLIPEGVRERVEKLAILPPEAIPLVTQDDSVREADGTRYQIIYYKNWVDHLELKLRRE